MDVNYKWYKKDILLDKYTNKEEIINYILNNKDYEKVLNDDKRVYIHKALSDINSNIIKWYDFKEQSDLLEISAGIGEYTSTFCEMVQNVTSICFDKCGAEALKSRCDKFKNLEIVCGSLEEINLDKKYDYITLFGVLENANLILDDYTIDSSSAAVKILKIVSKFLKKDGIILLCTDNRMSARNLSGFKDSIDKFAFSDIVHRKGLKSHITFNKKELIDIFSKCNIDKYNFYYPLPDYNFTSVIFSDDFLPKADNSKLMYNLCYEDFNNIFFDERALLKEFIRLNDFEKYTNCYFVELGTDVIKNKFVSFNNMRKKEYRNVTKMQDEYVIKNAIYEDSNHIQNIRNNIDILNSLNINTLDKVENNVVISKVIKNYKTLDSILCDCAVNDEKAKFMEILDNYFNYIESKLTFIEEARNNIFDKYSVNLDENIIKELKFVKEGFLDLTFENVFYDYKDYFVYDQEWYEENVPIEFIKYRAINNLYYYNFNIELVVKKQELYEKYNIDKYLKYFTELEQKWQNSIFDENKKSFFENACTAINTYEDIMAKKVKMQNEYDNKISMLENKINNLEETNVSLNQKLNEITNSKIWRYTKFLRKE